MDTATRVRVLVWTGNDDTALCGALASLPNVEIVRGANRGHAIEQLGNADGFVTFVARWDRDFAAVLAATPRIRWVQILNAGFDNMERLGLPQHVVVSTIGSVNSTVVAEHALLLLLALLRRVEDLVAAQRRGDWARGLAPTLRTLRGKRVAVLGYGHIGRTVAVLARAFGAEVTGVARSARVDADGVRVAPLAELATVLGAADAVIVTLPLNSATERIVGTAALASLKPGAYLVNVSRGGLIDTDALVLALSAGTLAGAALDVTDPEPLPPGHPLWNRPNVLITPHVAGLGGGDLVQREQLDLVRDNVRRFAAGEPLRHVAPLERR